MTWNEGGHEQKLSEILLEFAGPYLPEGERTLDEMRRAVSFAACVWNATVLEQSGGWTWGEFLRKAVARMSQEDAAGLVRAAETLRNRKIALHSEDRRTICEFTVTESDGCFHVTVASLEPGAEPVPDRPRDGVSNASSAPPWTRTFGRCR